MIIETKVGVCDRCKEEVSKDFYKLSVTEIKLRVETYSYNYLNHSDGIVFNNFYSEGYHLCDNCLKDFKQGFMKNEKTSSNLNS